MTSHQLVPRVNEKVSGNTAFELVHKQKQKICATEIFESELSIAFMYDTCIRLRMYSFHISNLHKGIRMQILLEIF